MIARAKPARPSHVRDEVRLGSNGPRMPGDYGSQSILHILHLGIDQGHYFQPIHLVLNTESTKSPDNHSIQEPVQPWPATCSESDGALVYL